MMPLLPLQVTESPIIEMNELHEKGEMICNTTFWVDEEDSDFSYEVEITYSARKTNTTVEIDPSLNTYEADVKIHKVCMWMDGDNVKEYHVNFEAGIPDYMNYILLPIIWNEIEGA